jgi:predicted choloylglycine hydrolase
MPSLPWDPRLNTLAEGCEKMLQRHAPEYVTEMEALAEAAEIDATHLKAFTICAPLQQTMPSCSVVAVMPERSVTGKLLVGRNYDFDYEISLDGSATFYTYPAGTMAHVGNCDIWVGREDGLNEAGLFVAMSATFLPGVQPGLTFWFVVRYMLEHCSTVEEAKRWIASVPHAQSRNFMLADKNDAVVVEASIEGVRMREATNGILAMTNHPEHPDWVQRMTFAPDDSYTRFARLLALPGANITAADVETALNDRPSGLCAYAKWDGKTYGTIWSVLACPEEGRFAIADGAGAEGVMHYREVGDALLAGESRGTAAVLQ